MQPSTGPGARFYQFCDALEVNNGEVASEEGWGVDVALPAWGAFFKDIYLGISEQSLLPAYRDVLYTETLLVVCGGISPEYVAATIPHLRWDC